MKSYLISVCLSITLSLTTYGQNFVFIGESSYPSTEKYTLKSNSDKENINDLKLVFAKEGENALIVVSTKLNGAVKIAEKLIIYLEDGSVISCVDRDINDNVDGIAITAYYLTQSELSKLKNSNINIIRYEIVCPVCGQFNSWEGTYSASNRESSNTDFTKVVAEFYKE